MGVLNLRGIPDDLIRRMKVRAAENGVTLRDECLEIIRRHCGVVAGDGGSEGEDAAGGKGGRGAGRSSVPVLQKAKKPAKHVHPVHPVRDELAPGGDGSPELSGKRPPSCTPGSCPHGKPHQAFCRAVGGGC